MTSTVKEIIRDIKLYELGIKDKPDGYDTLMGLRGLNSLKTEDPNVTHYGKNTNDIKFKYYNYDYKFISIKKELWNQIKDSFNLSYIEAKELTMWSIGSDPNLEGVHTDSDAWDKMTEIGSDPNLEGVHTSMSFTIQIP